MRCEGDGVGSTQSAHHTLNHTSLFLCTTVGYILFLIRYASAHTQAPLGHL